MLPQGKTQQRITAIKGDLAALRLLHKTVAERAGLHEMTVSRCLGGHNTPLSSTLDRIEAVIAEEKSALRKRLSEEPAAQPAA